MLVDTFKNTIEFRHVSFRAHLARTIFFVSFFPHLIAGPIVKAGEFMPQVGPKDFSTINFDKVAKLLIFGFFLKVVVADNLAVYTQKMLPPAFYIQSSTNLLIMLYGYSCQIFADFAGYSLIAVGLAALFGYHFPRNFDHPYLADSFSNFWTRWHMTLSRFLKEYLYIPLGGNRHGQLRTHINLLIVMFLGGLWHGGRWSYAVWGIWHGLCLSGERFCQQLFFRYYEQKKTGSLSRLFRICGVFSAVSLAWLLFRLPNIHDAFGYLDHVLRNRRLPNDYGMIAGILLFSLPVVGHHLLQFFDHKLPARESLRKFDPVIYATLLFLILTCSGDRFEFIYFQF